MKWTTKRRRKRRIKKIEEILSSPLDITIAVCASDFDKLTTNKYIYEIAKNISSQVTLHMRNLEDELQSLKQSLHR